MPDVLRYGVQVLFFAIIMSFIGYFSNNPIYHQFPEGMAQIKLSFAHGAARKIDCRKLTSKEIAKLPANQRRPNTCTRERIPLHVQLVLDGKLIYDDHLKAVGFFEDGPGRTYKKFIILPGAHIITARLRDTKRVDGFDYETTRKVSLSPQQNLAIDFKSDRGGFNFR